VWDLEARRSPDRRYQEFGAGAGDHLLEIMSQLQFVISAGPTNTRL
jgi:hypothetical protein